MNLKKLLSLKNNHVLIILITWALVQTFLLYKYGIITNNEAVKYIREANNFSAEKSFSENKYIFYSVYIFVHVFFKWFGFEVTGVYLFQLLFNLLALICFYKTLLFISKKITVAFWGSLLLVICFPWQYWTICLYTESFFCSLIIILTYCLFGNNKPICRYVFAPLLLIALIFSRPTGILLIPASMLLTFHQLVAYKKKALAFLFATCVVVVFLSTFYYEMNSAASYNFIKPFVEHNIICDVPDSAFTSTNRIYSGNIGGVISFIKDNPVTFGGLCVSRFISFWSLTRSFYTSMHNWLLRLFFYPLYLFAIIGLIQQLNKHKQMAIFCLITIIVFTLSVMLTCDEWSSRFIMPILPLVIFLAVNGIFATAGKFTRSNI